MQPSDLEFLLKRLQSGEINLQEALQKLRDLPFENLEFARVDHHRQLRQGFPEVVFCRGKTIAQITAITKSILDRGMTLLATHADAVVAETLSGHFPDLRYNETGRVLYSDPQEVHDQVGNKLLILTAGTADIPVAEEAYQSAFVMGYPARKLYDVGVAGIHRLLSHSRELAESAVIIVVAGMEGALPSVVGGLTAVPLIAVPASTGYGTSFGGITALLAMLNSCSNGITVVNIDNGFGAACAAARMLRLMVKQK